MRWAEGWNVKAMMKMTGAKTPEEAKRAVFPEEMKRIGEQERQKVVLESRLTVERELKVSIERDDTALIDRLAATVNRQLNERDTLLVRQFEEAIRRNSAESVRKISQVGKDSSRQQGYGH